MTDQETLDRRRFLQLSCLAATTTLAGCLGDGDNRTYTDWLPAQEAGLVVAYLDLDSGGDGPEESEDSSLIPSLLPSQETVLGGSDAGTGSPEIAINVDGTDDPLLQFPVAVGGQIFALSSLALAFAGLYDLLGGGGDSSVRELLVVDDMVVLTGDFDTDEIASRLREGPADPRFGVQHEAVGDLHDYELYASTDESTRPDGSSETFAAVDENAIVLGEDRSAIEAVVETHEGDRDDATAQLDRLEWLVDSVDTGQLVVGQVGGATVESFVFDVEDLPSLDLVRETDDLLVSLSVDADDGRTVVEFALAADELDENRRETLASRLGQDGDDVSHSGDTDRLTATASYADDVLETVEIDPEDETGDQEFESEVFDEDERVVAEVSFDDPDPNLATVTLTDDPGVDADTVRIETVVSSEESEVSGAWPGSWTTLFVDPDGDQIVVSAIDNDTAEVVHRETYDPSE